jgi:hypothetical protein
MRSLQETILLYRSHVLYADKQLVKRRFGPRGPSTKLHLPSKICFFSTESFTNELINMIIYGNNWILPKRH